LIYQAGISEAPYKKFDLSFCKEAIENIDRNYSKLLNIITAFRPECILMSSWAFSHYMRAAKALRGNGVFVVSAMDNQWRGTAKQLLGILSSRFFLKPAIDTFFVAGDRQNIFAKKLGFKYNLHGCYAADVKKFSCDVQVQNRNKNFLFVGRLKKIKGVDLLLESYLLYRSRVANPWGMLVVGTGELRDIFTDIPGVKVYGFVQPNDLPSIMTKARCFILPSRFEPWGVVIHEAAAAGLPIIATHQCGATTAFLRDGVNGYLVEPKARYIGDAMCRIAMSSENDVGEMEKASKTLAKLWNPEMLAKYFCSSVQWRIKYGKK
jgi:glycosyltransferase involved in cell wall biosynthesis